MASAIMWRRCPCSTWTSVEGGSPQPVSVPMTTNGTRRSGLESAESASTAGVEMGHGRILRDRQMRVNAAGERHRLRHASQNIVPRLDARRNDPRDALHRENQNLLRVLTATRRAGRTLHGHRSPSGASRVSPRRRPRRGTQAHSTTIQRNARMLSAPSRLVVGFASPPDCPLRECGDEPGSCWCFVFLPSGSRPERNGRRERPCNPAGRLGHQRHRVGPQRQRSGGSRRPKHPARSVGHAEPPANDTCSGATVLSSLYSQDVPFCTLNAATDGPANPLCDSFGSDQITNDGSKWRPQPTA